MARQLGIAKSHASRTVEDLVRQGLIERRADPADHRLQRLHLTAAAEQSMAAVIGGMRSWLSTVVATLPPDTAATLAEGLRQLLRAAMAPAAAE